MTGPGAPSVRPVLLSRRTADANGIKTNYPEAGRGDDTVVLIHGSGPGVFSYANWRLAIPALAENLRVIAPDMVGFGYSERPANIEYGVQIWADQVIGLMDALDVRQAHLIGNSLGGAKGRLGQQLTTVRHYEDSSRA